MSFYNVYRELQKHEINKAIHKFNDNDIRGILQKSNLTDTDFLALLSPSAEAHLEEMAQRANKSTIRNFGRVISLFTPMYLSNHCSNECVYCGFNIKNKLRRRTMSLQEVEQEGQLIARTGLRHLLVLTGESRNKASVDYIAACISKLRAFFSSVSVEIYPLDTEEYRRLIQAGADGMTMFQEVYNPLIYDQVHIKGPKKDYHFRLDAPERACMAGMRTVGIGPLIGLDDWHSELFALGLHAKYLQDKYPHTEISVSFPRMRPAIGHYHPKVAVSDKILVQMILALRLYLPRVGITISSREKALFRDRLMKLGVTKMSAGVCTEVGGRLKECKENDGQFEISDARTVDEMKAAIIGQGYQPVFKDWVAI